ncbi:hypothetical protein [Mariniplasma anaerobium]|uniref:Uncharacterized protein n=1 Tax=Mariniplasma anaerobium TaxID=2735436 RepID=A0A7U9TJ86_9MOLU|nr:hypothetical protein [Mariniplasma anaerobium]BCR35829.1 hypothetical protein MPAN_007220 [Mariniplasma anaerobium]
MKKNKELSQKETIEETKDTDKLETSKNNETEIKEDSKKESKKDKKKKKAEEKAKAKEDLKKQEAEAKAKSKEKKVKLTPEEKAKAKEDAKKQKAEDKVKAKEDKKRLKAEKKASAKEAKRLKDRPKWTKKYFSKFSGKEKGVFQKYVDQDYKNAILRAEKLSSIDKKAYKKPILIMIPDAFNKSSKVQYRLDKKEDGTVTQIYDQSLLTALFFGESTLFYYQANIDHRSGQIACDIAGEFNYFDVVHMETKLKYDNPDKPKYLALELEVGLSDGRMIPFHLRNHRLHTDYKLPEMLTKTEQQILDLFKTRVRQEKSM